MPNDVDFLTDERPPRRGDVATEQAMRLARLYLVLSRVNRAMETASNAESFLQSACEVVVDVGQFLMSWAGLVDPETGAVRPVATAGYDEGYTTLVRVELGGERSSGPTGQAVLTGHEVVCDDLATDERMTLWRDEALRRGYRSSIGLPLRSGARVLGVMTTYADTPNRFGPAEIELLQELGRDVSRGLAALTDAAARRQAETALAASEERFETSIDTLLDAFGILRAVRNAEGRVVDFVYDYVNEAACVANRASRDELVGASLLALLPNHESSGMLAAYAHVVDSGEPLILDDTEYADKWAGEAMVRYFDIRAIKLGDGVAVSWRDVTERRSVERRRAEELERRVRERTAALETARERAFAVAELTTATVQADSAREVAHALLQAAASVGAPTDGAVFMVAPDGWRAIDSFGLTPDQVSRIVSETDSGRTPINDAMEAGEALLLSNDSDDIAARYPNLRAMAEEIATRTRVVVPLGPKDASLGVLGLGFNRPLDDDEIAFVVSLANNAGHALERLRLTESEREIRDLLEAVVSQMPVGVSLVASSGVVTYRNAAFDALFGPFSADEGAAPAERAVVAGHHPDGRPYRDEEWPARRSLSTGETIAGEEIAIRRRDGTTGVLMQTSAPVHDAHGYPVAAVVVTIDITQRKEAEELRDAFIGILSHELRTPVTTIFGGAKLLETRGARLDPKVRESLVHDIAFEGERLTRLVDDLLVLARAERGADLTSRSAALVQHRLRSVVASLALEWPQRRFVLEIPEHVPPVTGDEAYLEQVFRNLLGNAAKYGRSEVIARVEIGRTTVSVTILDDGAGIDAAEIDRLFELFFRARATKHVPGAGIGLFVARRLVEAMGGTLSVANRPEGGAAFTVSLPEFEETGLLA